MVHRRTQAFVNEYAGALAPGRVIAVSMTAAAAILHRDSADDGLFGFWEASVRRQLTEEVAVQLAETARSR